MIRGKVRGWGAQFVALGIAFGCGKAADDPLYNSANTGGHSQTTGGLSTAVGGTSHLGGGSSTGGSINSGGAPVSSAGGSAPLIGSCSEVAVTLDPPCSSKDVIAPTGCDSYQLIEFSFLYAPNPLPKGDLWIVLLPPDDTGMGQGGEGGTHAALRRWDTYVDVFPPEAAHVGALTFELYQSPVTLTGQFHESELTRLLSDGYLQPLQEPNGPPGYPYYVGYLGIQSGDEILETHRIIIQPRFECIVE